MACLSCLKNMGGNPSGLQHRTLLLFLRITGLLQSWNALELLPLIVQDYIYTHIYT